MKLKSFRGFLTLWFLLFTVLPITGLTFYSLIRFEEASLTQIEVAAEQRRQAIVKGFAQRYNEARNIATSLSSDRVFIFEFVQRNLSELKSLAYESYGLSPQFELVLQRPSGEVFGFFSEVSLRTPQTRLQGLPTTSNASSFILGANTQDWRLGIRVPITKGQGAALGYLSILWPLNKQVLSRWMSTAEGLSFLVYGNDILGSVDEFQFFQASNLVEESEDGFYTLKILDQSYLAKNTALTWGSLPLVFGLVESKRPVTRVVSDVSSAFVSIIAAILVMLLVLGVLISSKFLRPIDDLVRAFSQLSEGKMVRVRSSQVAETSVLVRGFNSMASRIGDTQKDLEAKVRELEKANEEIKSTQAKLVQSAKMASLGQLVAGIAHELNNPIGFIYSNIRSLSGYSKDLQKLIESAKRGPNEVSSQLDRVDYDYIQSDLPKLIEACEDGSERVRQIVEGLRQFAKIDQSRPEYVDINKELQQTLQLMAGEFDSGIEVKTEFGKVPKLFVVRGEIIQVFLNLLANARQAIHGSGRIQIRTLAHSNHRVEISVQDSGEGMDDEQIAKIFDPFYTTRETGFGRGLGLSVSYGIIEKHGGEIKVQSQPGQGTTMTLLLPIS